MGNLLALPLVSHQVPEHFAMAPRAWHRTLNRRKSLGKTSKKGVPP